MNGSTHISLMWWNIAMSDTIDSEHPLIYHTDYMMIFAKNAGATKTPRCIV